MNDPNSLDTLFRDAVSAIDAGDVTALERLLAAHPRLVRERLDVPGAWLRDKVGGALDGFFRQPYLLWFVAEDPVLHGRLPPNIAAVARAIIQAARREGVESLQEQLDYALRLVAWSGIARECTLTERATWSVKMKRFGSDSMLPSKIRPTTSASRLITGLPELPPMMSQVLTKLNGVMAVSFDLRFSQSGGRSNGGRLFISSARL